MEKKKFVEIQSDITIQVTNGLSSVDYTRKDSDIPNRMNIKPNWSRCTVIIKQGKNLYPSEIAEWNTVKALEKQGHLTIGKYTDDGDDIAVQTKTKLDKEIARQKKNLSAIAKGE